MANKTVFVVLVNDYGCVQPSLATLSSEKAYEHSKQVYGCVHELELDDDQ